MMSFLLVMATIYISVIVFVIVSDYPHFFQERWQALHLKRFLNKEVNEATREWLNVLELPHMPESVTRHHAVLTEGLTDKKAFAYAASVFSTPAFTDALSKMIAIYHDPYLFHTFTKHTACIESKGTLVARNTAVTHALETKLFETFDGTMHAFEDKHAEYFRLLFDTKEHAFSHALTKEKQQISQQTEMSQPDTVHYTIPPLSDEATLTPEEIEEAQFEAILKGLSK